MIPRETIDLIYQSARIEEVIGDFVNLKRAGSNFKGLSPFTQEKTPSFMVSPAKQIYKCFSTGKGGNVVSFLMEAEQLSYVEALKYLARKYNIDIVEEKPSAEQVEAATKRETLTAVNRYAEQFFENSMWQNEEGLSVALSYFKERGFSQETIKKFKLGYCPEENGLTYNALKAGYKKELLLELGLTKEREGRTFDFFRGRVIFPIHALSGLPIAFAGRTLKKDNKLAKYFNSPESELYHKSNVLYGLHLAKSSIVKLDNCFLVEGYTDVISLHQAGVENVVASSGTSLTKEQIRLIKRYTQNITVLYDGDSAGIKASFRGIDLILEEGLNVRAVLFPDGEDPDSFAKKSSKTELEEFIKNNAQDFIGFKVGLLINETKNDPIKKAGLIKDIVHSIGLIPDKIMREVFIRNTADLLQVEEKTLHNEVEKSVKKSRQKSLEEEDRGKLDRSADANTAETFVSEENLPPAVDLPEASAVAAAQEIEIIRVLLNYGLQILEFPITDPENGRTYKQKMPIFKYILQDILEDELSIDHPAAAKIFNLYKELLTSNQAPDINLILRNPDPEIVQLAVNLTTEKYELSKNWEEAHKIYTTQESDTKKMLHTVQQPLFEFKQKKIELERAKIAQQIKELSTDPALEPELLELIQQKMQYDALIVEIAGKIQGRTIIH
ncbi:MAG: DNA primase [Luteibaculaceae bacterium]